MKHRSSSKKEVSAETSYRRRCNSFCHCPKAYSRRYRYHQCYIFSYWHSDTFATPKKIVATSDNVDEVLDSGSYEGYDSPTSRRPVTHKMKRKAKKSNLRADVSIMPGSVDKRQRVDANVDSADIYDFGSLSTDENPVNVVARRLAQRSNLNEPDYTTSLSLSQSFDDLTIFESERHSVLTS